MVCDGSTSRRDMGTMHRLSHFVVPGRLGSTRRFNGPGPSPCARSDHLPLGHSSLLLFEGWSRAAAGKTSRVHDKPFHSLHTLDRLFLGSRSCHCPLLRVRSVLGPPSAT